MDENVARLIFAAVMMVGFFFWLWSLQKALALGRQSEPADWRMLPEEQVAHADTETGSRIVRGEPELLSQSLARSLTQLGAGGFAPLFEIIERNSERIALKKTGPLMCNQPAGMYFSEAEITFEPLGNETTRVSYLLGFDRLVKRVRVISLSIILGIGLPVLLIVGGVIWFFVLPSPAPGVRWQVLQTFQIIHALWPPFLVLGLYNTGRRQAKTYFSNLLSTLELAETPGRVHHGGSSTGG
jgi:hypothetical protein